MAINVTPSPVLPKPIQNEAKAGGLPSTHIHPTAPLTTANDGHSWKHLPSIMDFASKNSILVWSTVISTPALPPWTCTPELGHRLNQGFSSACCKINKWSANIDSSHATPKYTKKRLPGTATNGQKGNNGRRWRQEERRPGKSRERG